MRTAAKRYLLFLLFRGNFPRKQLEEGDKTKISLTLKCSENFGRNKYFIKFCYISYFHEMENSISFHHYGRVTRVNSQKRKDFRSFAKICKK